ncbi:MAG TPA: hypothetical protein VLW85_14140 [Myxococcales bacterium]|nr:hypothetical protein [Myxococcales bacterium]
MQRPHRLLFPLGAALAWVGVLPWLFFSLQLRGVYEPLNAVLAYRSFLHPLAELEGFFGCFAAGLVFERHPPGRALLALAIAAPIAAAALGAIGQWQLGQLVWLVFAASVVAGLPRRIWPLAGVAMGAIGAALAMQGDFRFHELGRDLVMQGMFAAFAVAAGMALRGDAPRWRMLHALGALLLAASFLVRAQHLAFALRALVLTAVASPLRPPFEFGPRELRRSFAHMALWLLAIGNAWVALSPPVKRAGLHVVFLGSFAALLVAALVGMRADLKKLGACAALFALSMLGRALVELDPGSFHLWMGISSAAFLIASVVLVRTKGAPQPSPLAAAAAEPRRTAA